MSASATAMRPRAATLGEQLDFRRDCLRNKNHVPIGRMITIRLGIDDSAEYFREQVRQKLAPITQKQGLMLDWGVNGPQIAQAVRDRDVYVFPRGVNHPPKIADPVDGAVGARKITQDLRHFASGKIFGKDGSMFLVLQPVEQVVVFLAGSHLTIMNGRTHPMDGTKPVLLINPSTWEGHIAMGLLTFD